MPLFLIDGMAAGLAHAHSAGRVHGDFSPLSVHLGENDEPCIIDLDTTRRLRAVANRGTHRPFCGLRHPARSYASPEVLSGAAPVASDDVFSLACIGYELLTGLHPFGGLNAMEFEAQGERVARHQLTPRSYAALCRGLAFERANRTVSAPQLLAELGPLGTLGDSPKRLSVLSALRSPWLVAGVGGLAVGALGAYLLTRSAPTPGPAEAPIVETPPALAAPPAEAGATPATPVAADTQTGVTPDASSSEPALSPDTPPTPEVSAAVAQTEARAAPVVSGRILRDPEEIAAAQAAAGVALRTPAGQPFPQEGWRDCSVCPALTMVSMPALAGGGQLAMGITEVTVAQYDEFVRDTGHAVAGCDTYDGAWRESAQASYRTPGFAQSAAHPVTCVSWSDARAYADWLSTRTGRGYRLPTSLEWESAAGPQAIEACDRANLADASAAQRYPGWSSSDCDDGQLYTAPAGSLAANAMGLHDMYGNLFEWVQDCWEGVVGGCQERILRGGSWFTPPQAGAGLSHFPAGHRASSFGFRVVRAPALNAVEPERAAEAAP